MDKRIVLRIVLFALAFIVGAWTGVTIVERRAAIAAEQYASVVAERDRLLEQIGEFNKELDAGIESLDARISGIVARAEKVEGRVQRIEALARAIEECVRTLRSFYESVGRITPESSGSGNSETNQGGGESSGAFENE